MARRAAVYLGLATLLAAGCSTTAGQQLEQKVLTKSNLGADAVKALQDLKAGLAPVLDVVAQDSAATRGWANTVLGPKGSNPDPIKYALANACPTAVDAVGPFVNQTIDGIITQIQAITGTPTDPTAPQGRLILFLTQLKYGPQTDPRVQITALRAQLELQVDALFTGCMHLFPQKQVNDLLRLAARAGLVVGSSGSLAPVLGVLP